ncbi:flagellar protein FliT [Bacillus sp. FJAT-27445]|uniref:flagellar protein FliT n=1 Tax=Bacillus sp. FJAT-27445 TaxID=1679166 RepID=UPI00074418EE|nr:flagellar protein FliT [Bacillus sp. FJAT-27445]
MLEEKFVQLKKFGSISEKLLESLKNGRNDEVPALLEERDACISAIDRLDQASGGPFIDIRIKELLMELAEKEKVLNGRFKETLSKMSRSIRDVRQEQYVTRQYDDWVNVTEGYFYDKKS